MTPLVIVLWIMNIAIDTGGQLAFKAAAVGSVEHKGLAHWQDMLSRPWIWVGIACYVVEFILWLAFLSLVPLSTGVMLASINTVVIMIAGRLWFNEKLTSWRLTGILLIAAGVAVVGLG